MSEKIEKPWGHEIIWANTKNYVGKILHIDSGHRLSKQYHQTKEETIYVLKGILYNYDIEGNIQKLMPGDSLHIQPHQVHRFCADKTESVTLIEVSTSHLDDVVRLEDDYDRLNDNSSS